MVRCNPIYQRSCIRVVLLVLVVLLSMLLTHRQFNVFFVDDSVWWILGPWRVEGCD